MASLIVVEDLAAPAVIGRGGQAMLVLQFLNGLERLGHRVLFVEFLSYPPDEAARRYFDDVIGRWWSHERAALVVEPTGRSVAGLDSAAIARWAVEADAVVTLAAHYRREPWPLVGAVRPRILFEQDPGYTQLWAHEGDPVEIYGEHDFFFTVGSKIGSPDCTVPTLGIDWRPLWNPVVLDWWSPPRALARDRFTTVAAWRDYGYLEFEGRVLGPKVDEFHKFIELPRMAGEPLELALAIDPDDPDVELLAASGWRIESPKAVSDPGRYRDYVAGSLAEFSAVKGGYAGTRCGWFSDRSACYLAAGRPVVLQATGFEDLLPTGRGLFAVHTVGEAVEALRAVRRDYDLHSEAARSVAREFFDSDVLLTRLLEESGVPVP